MIQQFHLGIENLSILHIVTVVQKPCISIVAIVFNVSVLFFFFFYIFIEMLQNVMGNVRWEIYFPRFPVKLPVESLKRHKVFTQLQQDHLYKWFSKKSKM